MPRRPVERAAAAIAAVAFLPACAGPLSTLEPAGPVAGHIALLWWIMFWGAAVLAAGTFGLYFVAFRRPGLLSRFTPMQWIVGGGLVMPIVVLTALTITAFVIGERIIPRPLADRPLQVRAIAHQWDWNFDYPDAGDERTTPVLHIPAGEPVDVTVVTQDVIHSFWVPRLAGKIDAIPGHFNTVRIQADRPGTYRGVCAEFCGDGHARMDFAVVAHPPAEYETMLSRALEGEGAE